MAAVRSLAHVVAARDPYDVAGLCLDRAAEGVRVLPVEVPARDVEQHLARAVPGLSSTRIDVPSRCMCPATTWIVVGVVMRRSHVETAPASGSAALPRQRRGGRPA